MAKKQDQYITRQEFNELSAKVDGLKKGIDEILYILNTVKGLASFIKMFGGIATALGAIFCFFQGLKGWFKQ